MESWVILLLLIILCRNVILQCIANMVLYLTGWKPLPKILEYILEDEDKLVLIYPHTSYWDSFYMIMYRLANPPILGDLYFLIRPDFLDIPLFGKFLMSIGAIKATCSHRKNGGRVQGIVNFLKKKERFHLVISPKGTTSKAQWRSGYYYITSQLDARITVVGFDYLKKEVIISQPFLQSKDREVMERWLKQNMRKINPCNPENIEY